MSEKETSIGKEIYSGAAGFGRLWAVISAVIGTILSILLMIGGAYIIYHRSYLRSVKGEVLEDSVCSTTTDAKGNSSTSCMTKVTYEVDGHSYPNPQKPLNSGSKSYRAGQPITVYYDPNNPNDADLNPVPKWIGILAIVISIVIIIGSWFWVWVTRKYKFAAAAGGASHAVDMVRTGPDILGRLL